MTAESILFALLRAEVCGEAVDEEIIASLSGENLEKIYTLAKKHDLAHLAGDALSKLGALGDDEVSRKLKQAAFQAVYRYARLNRAYQSICKVLEEAKIPFMPLKGSVLRDYYPEPWMRTSCDIDILVHQENVQPAIAILTQVLRYRFEKQWIYEYSLFSPDGIHLELHSNTIEKVESGSCEEVLWQVWERSNAEEGCTYKRIMTGEMFYFYHIQHMSKHFTHGGCGIRPYLDIWIMNHRMQISPQKRQALLEKGELIKFSTAAEALAEAWFAGAKADGLSQQMGQLVITGGMYGNKANQAVIGGAQKGSRVKYVLSRIFMPYDQLQYVYPVLQKNKWLYPFCQIPRWFRMLLGGGVGTALRELKATATASAQEIATTEDMLKHLGL